MARHIPFEGQDPPAARRQPGSYITERLDEPGWPQASGLDQVDPIIDNLKAPMLEYGQGFDLPAGMHVCFDV